MVGKDMDAEKHKDRNNAEMGKHRKTTNKAEI